METKEEALRRVCGKAPKRVSRAHAQRLMTIMTEPEPEPETEEPIDD